MKNVLLLIIIVLGIVTTSCKEKKINTENSNRTIKIFDEGRFLFENSSNISNINITLNGNVIHKRYITRHNYSNEKYYENYNFHFEKHLEYTICCKVGDKVKITLFVEGYNPAYIKLTTEGKLNKNNYTWINTTSNGFMNKQEVYEFTIK